MRLTLYYYAQPSGKGPCIPVLALAEDEGGGCFDETCFRGALFGGVRCVSLVFKLMEEAINIKPRKRRNHKARDTRKKY